jgi:hypothetical protein
MVKRTHAHEVRHYYVYEMPKKCEYEIKENLYVMVEHDPYYGSYSANLHPEKRINSYGCGNSWRAAIRQLLKEIVDDYESYKPLIAEEKLGGQLSEFTVAFEELFERKDAPVKEWVSEVHGG